MDLEYLVDGEFRGDRTRRKDGDTHSGVHRTASKREKTEGASDNSKG